MLEVFYYSYFTNEEIDDQMYSLAKVAQLLTGRPEIWI